MKFLASDLDGTFIKDNRSVEGNIEAVRKLRQAGNKFIVATGRDLRGVLKIEDYKDMEYDYLVLCNGSLILDGKHNVIQNKVIEHNIAFEFLSEYKDDENVIPFVVFDGRTVMIGDPSGLGSFKHYFEEFSTFEEMFKERRDYAIISFVSKNDNYDIAKKYCAEMNEKYGDHLEIVRNMFFIDVMCKDTSKGKGIKTVLEIEGGSLENLYTIGDSLNDLSMLDITDNAYTFKDVEDIVKDHANKCVDYVHECVDDMLN